ncbi:carboxypeptidase-like regulatory domain-containing protein [Patescibacteria group bacterium]
MKKGFSLMDIVVGVSVIALAFWGVFGVFQFSVKLIANNKAKIGAMALANEKMEFIRSLAYDDVGTISGIPSGDLEQEESVSLNGIDYIVATLVQYVDAPEDGEGGYDENSYNADYKVVKVDVGWDLYGLDKSFFIVSNIVPKGMETVAGGGTLTVNVFDAVGVPIQGASVIIENNEADPSISVDILSNIDGKVSFPGSPAVNNYQISVTKDGYSSSQTYTSDVDNPNPTPSHFSVLESTLTTASFSIDLLSTKTVETYSTSTALWQDDFSDSSKIFDLSDTVVGSEVVILEEDFETGYPFSGEIHSVDIDPEYLYQWLDFSWNDEEPVNTNILYRVYFDNSTSFILISDLDLAGNSSGFDNSPIDLSGLDVNNYPAIRVAGFLSTTDVSSTPSILDWEVGYIDGLRPLPNTSFTMRGSKTIGTDAGDNPIYKYSESLQTDLEGILTINNLEWDNYIIYLGGEPSGYATSTFSKDQPFGLNPDVSTTTQIILSPID